MTNYECDLMMHRFEAWKRRWSATRRRAEATKKAAPSEARRSEMKTNDEHLFEAMCDKLVETAGERDKLASLLVESTTALDEARLALCVLLCDCWKNDEDAGDAGRHECRGLCDAGRYLRSRIVHEIVGDSCEWCHEEPRRDADPSLPGSRYCCDNCEILATNAVDTRPE